MIVTGQQTVTGGSNSCPMVVEASGYLDGNDLGGNLTGFVTESYRECMSACCANYPRCNNYAYNTFTRQCYLKGNYGSFRNSTDGSTMYGIIPAPQVIQGVTNASGSGYQVDVRDNFRLDWWGDDLKADFFVADWAACQQECLNAAPTCASFAFRKSDRKCWTKRSATFGSNPPADTNWLVGVIQQPIYSEGTYAVTSSGTSSCAVTFKLGLNYYGNDITGWSGVFLPKAGDCAKACCDNVPLCGSWSYDGRTRKCWLKSRYGDNPSNTTDYISGIIPPPPVVVGQVTAAPSRARNGTTPPDGLGTVVADGAFGFEIIDGFQIGWSWEISGYNWYFSATWRTCMADCAGLGPMCGSFRYDKPQRRCVLRRSIWGFANDPTRADVNQMYGVMNQPAIRTGIQNVTASKAVFNQTPPDGLPIIDPPPPLLTTSTTATATRTQTATSTPRTVTKTSTTIVAKLDVLPVRTSTRTPSRTSTRTSSKTSSRTASRTKTKTRTSTAAALRLQLVADKVATTTVRKSSTSTRKSTTKALALLAGKLTTKKALRRLLERQTSAPKVCQSNTTDNMDPQVWGWDISKYSGYWSASADTCAADCCALRNRCTLWIYRKSDRQCWLKTYAEVASPKNNTDYAYGLMVLPPVKTGAQNITASLATYPGRPSQGFDGTIGSKTAVVTIFDNKDPWQWGGEITNYTSYDSYLTCAEDCVALAPLCGMFVYSKRDRNCLLRTLTAASSDGPKDNTNLVYGVVAQPPVAEGTQVIQGSNAQAGGPAPNGISFVPGPASGTVSIVDNTNIWYWSWYGDLRGYSSYFSRDWRTCAADCVALSPICGSFAYQKSRRTCWLKTSAAAGTPPKVDLDMVYGLMQQPTAVSGFAPVTATNSTSQCTINIMPGKGIWGRDVAGFAGYFSPTYQTCAADW